MGIYGQTAVLAAKILHEQKSYTPEEAWEVASKEIHKSEKSRKKGCPRVTFIGLCEIGAVKDVPPSPNPSPSKNKDYAERALGLLRKNPGVIPSGNTLWRLVSQKEGKSHNQQMDVILSLWKERLAQ